MRDKSGLETPTKQLAEKKGRGIYRRFFYFIPSKGTGAVDRSRLPTLNADGTSKLHEFIDIGRGGQGVDTAQRLPPVRQLLGRQSLRLRTPACPRRS